MLAAGLPLAALVPVFLARKRASVVTGATRLSARLVRPTRQR
jgi:hypothetical protein